MYLFNYFFFTIINSIISNSQFPNFINLTTCLNQRLNRHDNKELTQVNSLKHQLIFRALQISGPIAQLVRAADS